MEKTKYRITFDLPVKGDVTFDKGWTCNGIIVSAQDDGAVNDEILFQKIRHILNRYLELIRYETGQLQVHLLNEAQFRLSCCYRMGEDRQKWTTMIHLANCSGAPMLPLTTEYWLYNVRDLRKSANSAKKTAVEEQLLCDAYGFLEVDDIKRAVLEAAIAAEIMIKGYIRRRGGPLGRLIVEHRNSGFSVIDYFDQVLARVKGEQSLKHQEKDIYNALKKLFEIRNKVAHTGQCVRPDGVRIGAEEARHLLEAVEYVAKRFASIEIAKRPSVLNFP